MNNKFITCDGCGASYLGQEYDSKTKKVKGGIIRTVTYETHCSNCDQPVFEDKDFWE